MIVYKNIKREVEEVHDVICDSCRKSCKTFLDKNNTTYNFEHMTLSALWGFSSNKDLERWEAHVCEKCVDEKFTFIKFKKDNYPPIPSCPV